MPSVEEGHLVHAFQSHRHLWWPLVSHESDGPWQVLVKSARTDAPREATYTRFRVIGNGSFGVVCMAQDMASKENVAIKIVYQDKRFKVRWIIHMSGPYDIILYVES